MLHSAARPGTAVAARNARGFGSAVRPFKADLLAGPVAGLCQPSGGAGVGLRSTRRVGFSSAALAVAVQRSSAAEDAPRDPEAAAAYRRLLDAEEEAGIYEDADGEEEERVEVDATALPDDTLAVRASARRDAALVRCSPT
jgi:hypothetical protein